MQHGRLVLTDRVLERRLDRLVPALLVEIEGGHGRVEGEDAREVGAVESALHRHVVVEHQSGDELQVAVADQSRLAPDVDHEGHVFAGRGVDLADRPHPALEPERSTSTARDSGRVVAPLSHGRGQAFEFLLGPPDVALDVVAQRRVRSAAGS